VLTFVLGGTGKLPPSDATEEPIQDDPAFVIDPAKVTLGASIYNTSCMVCHGVGAAAGGAAPDLRQSTIPLDADAFRSVVHDGALMARGMGKFANLSDAELEGLRHMIRQRAREGLEKK
jgi:quinohemoprotein ethanol dehydrogenase